MRRRPSMTWKASSRHVFKRFKRCNKNSRVQRTRSLLHKRSLLSRRRCVMQTGRKSLRRNVPDGESRCIACNSLVGSPPFRPLAVQAISMLCRLFCQSIVPAAGARLPYPRAHQILAHHRAKIPIQPQLLRELSPLPRSALPWALHP